MLPVIRESVPLAPLTTFELGGAARFFADIVDEAELGPALAWAQAHGLPVFVLGGGSNLVVGDDGFPGLVLRLATRGRDVREHGAEWRIEAKAGEPWDEVVADTVGRDAAGIECLSGIPGSTGAAPVQNIGAYGQEVGPAIRSVRVFDRDAASTRELTAADCAFGYRDSLFKHAPGRFVILSVTLGLAKHGTPSVRYAELAAALTAQPTLAEVRATVLALRRRKSMVVDADDPNRRSAGSFFTNPVVGAETAAGLLATEPGMPRFPLPDGRVKLAAGWLIEHSGVGKGFRMGPVGLSSQHALALVHHGGGRTADLLALARHVHRSVLDRFGIALVPEPVFLGVDWRP